MRKLNVVGLILSFSASVVTLVALWNNITLSTFMVLPMVVGVALLGLDRWAGDSRYGLLAVAVFWTIYWGFIAFGFLGISALFAFGVSFGHGEARQAAVWYMFGYFGLAVLFSVLGVANLIRFFVGLFSLPKLRSNNR